MKSIPAFALSMAMLATASANSLAGETFFKDNFKFEVIADNAVAISAPVTLPEGDYVIPDTYTSFEGDTYLVTAVAREGFYKQDGIRNLTLGNNISEIGDYAFRSCKGLTSISGGDALRDIGIQAFANCTALKSVNLETLEKVGERMFSDCYALESVHLPAATQIGNFAFYQCEALTDTQFSPELSWIGNSAFSLCHSMTSFHIPDKCVISNFAFYMCQQLNNVILPYNLYGIGEKVFDECTHLTNIYILCDDYPMMTDGISDGLLTEMKGRRIYCAPALYSFLAENTQNTIVNLNSLMKPETLPSGTDIFKFTLTPAHIPATSIVGPTFVKTADGSATIQPDSEGVYTVDGDAALICWKFEGRSLTYLIHKDFGASSIGSVATDSQEKTAVYSLDGRYIGETADGCTPGIYIIKSGDKTTKTIVFD